MGIRPAPRPPSRAQKTARRRPSWSALLAVTALAAPSCGDPAEEVIPVPVSPTAVARHPETTPHQGGVALSGGLVTRDTGEGCADCHQEVLDLFATSGMHSSMTLPSGKGSPEARMVGHEVVDPETGMTGRMELRDGAYVQVLLYRDPEGVVRASHEMRIDLVVGSGHFSRSYFQVEDGFFHLLPLTWYREIDDIALSPGPGFRAIATRQGTHLCVACHTGWVEPLDPFEAVGFRGEVTLGIGCERCHGNGQRHAETGDPRDIINPARLDGDRQSEVCYQCHLSESLQLVKPGRLLAEYTPGQRLGSVFGVFDAQGSENDAGTGIAGHAERMHLSACFRGSPEMTCTTCHNPHRGHRDRSVVDDTAGGCLVCHAVDDCGEAHGARGQKRCSDCHMAKLASSDIVHTTPTDHFIQVRPPAAPADRRPPESRSVGAAAMADAALVNVLDPGDELPGSRLLKAMAYLSGAQQAIELFDGNPRAYARRARALAEAILAEDPENRLARRVLAEALYRAGDGAAADREIERLLAAGRRHSADLWLRAYIRLERDPASAVGLFEDTARALPDDRSVAADCADLLHAVDRTGDALSLLADQRARIGPGMVTARAGAQIAWEAGRFDEGLLHAYDLLLFRPREPFFLASAGDFCAGAGHRERAVSLHRQALAFDAEYLPSLLSLAHLELRSGRRRAALDLALRAERLAPASPDVRDLIRSLR